MMYADGEVSYHEKNAVNKIMKAANDLRVALIIHGAVQMMYADGEVSYHEKNAVNKIMKAANLSSAEVVRCLLYLNCRFFVYCS